MAAGPDFMAADLEAIQVMRRYYRWKRDLIRPFAGNRVLELGCGTGLVLSQMLPLELAVGVDVNAACISRARERLRGHPEVRFHVLDAQSETLPDFASERFTSAVFCSSLEAIADDALALRRAASILPSGGRLIVFAAAMPAITGELDRAFGSRRYDKETIVRMMKEAGLSVAVLRYVNLLGALGWWWDSRILKRKAVPGTTYRTRDLTVPLARVVDWLTGPPAGRSLLAVGVKP